MIARGLTAALALLLLGAAPDVEEQAVLRATLERIGTEHGYCFETALGEPPFADIRRGMAQYEADRQALAKAEGKPPPSPRTEAEMRRAITFRVAAGWIGPNDRPLAKATFEQIRRAATTLAWRGDPAPLPEEPVADMNASAATGDVPAVPVPPDHGRLSAELLAKGQRLQSGDRCDLPVASLSAVAREGVIAFVDVGFVWGALAGHGETWAMRRDERGDWMLVARRRTWIS